MDTKELLKKYWFVGLVGVVLLVFIGVYAVADIKNKPVTVNTKKVDGEYIVYSIGDKDVTADEVYDHLFELSGQSAEMLTYERVVFDLVKTTSDMEENAAQMAQAYIQYYDEETLLNTLVSTGYKNGINDLTNYIIDSNKQEEIVKEYALANSDTYVKSDLGTDGRIIYHILVKVADIEEVKDENGNVVEYRANPTDTEKAKLEVVLGNLEKDNKFEQVAYTYTDDTGSKNNGGYIGAINTENKDNYYKTFAEAAMLLEEGEVSKPVISQAGYHIIYNAGSTIEKAVEDFYFMNDVKANHPYLVSKAVISKGNELNIKVNSESLKEYIASIESEAE